MIGFADTLIGDVIQYIVRQESPVAAAAPPANFYNNASQYPNLVSGAQQGSYAGQQQQVAYDPAHHHPQHHQQHHPLVPQYSSYEQPSYSIAQSFVPAANVPSSAVLPHAANGASLLSSSFNLIGNVPSSAQQQQPSLGASSAYAQYYSGSQPPNYQSSSISNSELQNILALFSNLQAATSSTPLYNNEQHQQQYYNPEQPQTTNAYAAYPSADMSARYQVVPAAAVASANNNSSAASTTVGSMPANQSEKGEASSIASLLNSLSGMIKPNNS